MADNDEAPARAQAKERLRARRAAAGPAGPFLKEYPPNGVQPQVSAQKALVLFYRNGGHSVVTVTGTRHVDKRALARPHTVCEIALGTYQTPLEMELPAGRRHQFLQGRGGHPLDGRRSASGGRAGRDGHRQAAHRADPGTAARGHLDLPGARGGAGQPGHHPGVRGRTLERPGGRTRPERTAVRPAARRRPGDRAHERHPGRACLGRGDQGAPAAVQGHASGRGAGAAQLHAGGRTDGGQGLPGEDPAGGPRGREGARRPAVRHGGERSDPVQRRGDAGPQPPQPGAPGRGQRSHRFAAGPPLRPARPPRPGAGAVRRRTVHPGLGVGRPARPGPAPGRVSGGPLPGRPAGRRPRNRRAAGGPGTTAGTGRTSDGDDGTGGGDAPDDRGRGSHRNRGAGEPGQPAAPRDAGGPQDRSGPSRTGVGTGPTVPGNA